MKRPEKHEKITILNFTSSGAQLMIALRLFEVIVALTAGWLTSTLTAPSETVGSRVPFIVFVGSFGSGVPGAGLPWPATKIITSLQFFLLTASSTFSCRSRAVEALV